MWHSRSRDALVFLVLSLLALSRLESRGVGDVNLWLNWIHNSETHGLIPGYERNVADYPPLSSVLLWLAARAGRSLGASEFTALKVSLYLFLIGTAAGFWLWCRKRLLASAVLAALTLSSVSLGYLDVYMAPPFLLALWALERRRPLLFSLAFGLSCLVKWQPLITAPFLLFYALAHARSEERRVRHMLALIVPGAMLAVAAVSLFGVEVLRSFGRSMAHGALSANALNANWIATHALHVFTPETYGPLVGGYATYIHPAPCGLTLVSQLVFAGAYLTCLVRFVRSGRTFRELIRYSLTGYLAYFILNIGVHENHLFLAVILAAVGAAVDDERWSRFALWAIVANVNLLLFYGIDGSVSPSSRVVGVDLALPFACVAVGLFLRELRLSRPVTADPVEGEDAQALLGREVAGQDLRDRR